MPPTLATTGPIVLPLADDGELLALLANAPTFGESKLEPMGEGVDDPNILRAVFVIGAGGSGKSLIAREMFAGRGLKFIDQDRHLERIYKAAGKSLADVGDSYAAFKDAQATARKERDHYARQRLGLVVDATGWQFERIEQPVRKLRALGYDCYLVFVTTTFDTALRRNDARAEAGGRKVPDSSIERAWVGAHANLSHYRALFGPKNTVVVQNDEDIDAETWDRAVAPELYRVASRLLERPLKNKVGQKWLAARMQAVRVETTERPTVVLVPALFGSDRLSLSEAAPTRLFHGRSVRSTVFDLKYVGRGHDQEGPGFYFTSDAADARRYAAPNGVVLECELRLGRELSRTGKVKRSDVVSLIKAAPKLADTLTNWAEDPDAAMEMAVGMIVGRDPFDAFTQVWIDFYRNAPDKYLREVVRLGYDHTTIQRDGAKHVIVFNPRAITVAKEIPFAATNEAKASSATLAKPYSRTHYGEADIVLDGEVIGSMDYWTDRDRSVQIEYIGIDKKHQREGHALAVLRQFMAQVKRAGMRQIMSEPVWKGSYDMLLRAFGRPDYLGDTIRQLNVKTAREGLPDESPERDGVIDGGERVSLRWDL